jgi:hypothetical protein
VVCKWKLNLLAVMIFLPGRSTISSHIYTPHLIAIDAMNAGCSSFPTATKFSVSVFGVNVLVPTCAIELSDAT